MKSSSSPLKWLAALAVTTAPLHAAVSVVDGPDLSKTNSNYTGNRAPLEPAKFLMLPVDAVEPEGWLKEYLNRQRSGLTGHLGEISAWLQKDDNAWLSKDGKGKYGWEELPYWLKGYIELGYLLKDQKMMDESKVWVEGALASQRPDGDFGPDQKFDDDGSRDFWANMIMLFVLESYYDHTGDKRVIDLMTRYFHFLNTVPDNMMLTHYWQKMRGGDNLQAVHWLYNRTGDAELLKLGEKLHRVTADWTMPNDLPNWHNVNIAECFREPGQFWLQSKKQSDLDFAYANFKEVRKRYGQVPGGMFGGDENCRKGYDDPHQAVETCGMVEQMLSDEMLTQITGDPFWVDNCEDVAFNTYPAAVMPDFSALRYLTAPNMVVSDSANHAPGIDNKGPFLMMNPFSSRCCQHNHSHGWPYFAKNLWMATPDNGVLAAMYSANKVTVKVANGVSTQITEETKYPFEDTIRFKVNPAQTATFPLYLRIPSWAEGAKVTINGADSGADAKAGKFVKIDREWKAGDALELKLPMSIKVKTWEANHNSVSVSYGPLTYSLKIGERYDRHDSTKTAIGDSSWQKGADPSKWPSYEIHPTTAWNYGLILDKDHPEKSFTVEKGSWPTNNFPFTTDAVPISLKVKGKKIPEWTIDRHGLCGALQDSPVASSEPEETLTLIPMGAARLRISSFPVIGTGNDAKKWTAPVVPKKATYKVTASHVHEGDSADAVNDGLAPQLSNDESIPRMTWWNHKGTGEWVQYDLPTEQEVSGVSVYWFDDTGKGQCRIPQSWKVLYQKNGEWVPAADAFPAPVKDTLNQVSFKPVKTKAVRIEVKLRNDFSGGILEWTLNTK